MSRPVRLDQSHMDILRIGAEWFFRCCFLVGSFGAGIAFIYGWWVLGILLGICFGLLLYMRFIEPHWYEVVTHHFSLRDGVKRGVRIVFLSDIHAGHQKTKRAYNRIWQKVQSLQPDIVLFGGDFVEVLGAAIHDLEGISQIQPSIGTFFVLGNHDYWDDPSLIARVLKEIGAQDLTNACVQIGEGGLGFSLVGLDDAWLGTPRIEVMPPAAQPTILLTHESDILIDLPEGAADLVFLGHTHGGQIRLPWKGAVTTLPQSTPQWLDRGLKEWRRMRLIISQGLGESTMGVRFWARPQIVVVEI